MSERTDGQRDRQRGQKTEGTMKNRQSARQKVKQNQYDSKMRIGVAETDVSMATNWNLSKIVMIK